MNSIPMDEWLKAVEDAMQERVDKKDEGFTTQELSSMLKVNNDKVRFYLREMIRLGKVVSALGYRTAIDGRLHPVPVYILKGKAED